MRQLSPRFQLPPEAEAEREDGRVVAAAHPSLLLNSTCAHRFGVIFINTTERKASLKQWSDLKVIRIKSGTVKFQLKAGWV